jgi:predicted transcriptional regulator
MRKNTNLFHIKMKFLEKEFGNNLYSQGYNEKDGQYSIPIDKSLFKTFQSEYPDNIKEIIQKWNQNT